MITRRAVLKGLAGGASALVGLGGWVGAVEPGLALTVARYDIPLPRWPAGWPPLRIAVLTDIHAMEPHMPARRIARIVATANALQPDLVVLLGDYVGTARLKWRHLGPEEWAPPLGRLRAPLGRFAILGNHDYWWDAGRVRRALAAQHIPLIENGVVRLSHEGKPFWLAGTASMVGVRLGPGRFRGLDDLPGTLAKVGDDAPVILLAHEPDIFARVPDRVALTLCGHTHGGQVRIPVLGSLMVPSAYGNRYVYGHIVEEGRHLLVSSGLGCSLLPVRFLVPPEIAVVTIRPGNPGLQPAIA